MYARPAPTITAPPPFPTHPQSIVIYHPAYNNVRLFSCFMLDSDGAGRYGCLHRLVLDACQIIANNVPGFLSPNPNGIPRVPAAELVLTDTRYYFIVESMPQYPIVVDFEAWQFPSVLPEHWVDPADRPLVGDEVALYQRSPSRMSDGVKELDGSCIITDTITRDVCHNAHLSPHSLSAWFSANRMYDYNIYKGNSTPDDVANGVSLRADLHLCLDGQSMVFYPIGSDTVVARPYPPRVARVYLYTRFAFNVISRIYKHRNIATVPVSAQVVAEKARLKPAQGSSFSSVSGFSSNPTDDDNSRLEDMKAAWFREHPQIRQTSLHDGSQPHDQVLHGPIPRCGLSLPEA
ncbi:hypothetical protein C8Q80DRAFT_1190492 [Daedaleopsis nitida]|nr:hypothetical protein C8Q80DRAFT_1190492 [Daedaleopsis nitida]